MESKEILARFVAGEIDKIEFDSCLMVLSGDSEHTVSAQ